MINIFLFFGDRFAWAYRTGDTNRTSISFMPTCIIHELWLYLKKVDQGKRRTEKKKEKVYKNIYLDHIRFVTL